MWRQCLKHNFIELEDDAMVRPSIYDESSLLSGSMIHVELQPQSHRVGKDEMDVFLAVAGHKPLPWKAEPADALQGLKIVVAQLFQYSHFLSRVVG